MTFLGIIPARYASTRFPGKPLADIAGKSMIQRVWEQAIKSTALARVMVATDDERIAAHVRGFGGEAVLTDEEHPSGTDRCQQAFQALHEPYDYIINIQGDEPFIDPSQLDLLASVCDGTTELATLIIPVSDQQLLFSEGEVKVVLNHNMEALYFSRCVIPFLKNVPVQEWHLQHSYYRHAGMYAYRADVLEAVSRLPVSTLEQAESLEQLRWLEAGYKIRCAVTTHESHCVDTPDDVAQVLRLLERGLL